MFEVYKDAEGRWNWRLNLPNGEALATGVGAYARRGNAVKAIERVKTLAATSGIVEVLPLREVSRD
jgi:uncharacterized protein YegP (UPF0339 family)